MDLRKDLDAILAEKGLGALLLYSESFKDVSMYYLTGFLAPDPFILLKRVDGEPTIVIGQMEFPRAQKESIVKDVRPYTDYDYLRMVKAAEEPNLGVMRFLASVVKRELGEGTIIGVPSNFPALTADTLRQEGLTIKPVFNLVEKARETKEPEEVKEISGVQKVVEEVVAEIIDLIANCQVGPGDKLIYESGGRKEPLTVGKVKTIMGHKFLDHWCTLEQDIIVAVGPPSANPHYYGEPQDELRANQPIVLDISPRSLRRRYWTDMTRTVVKGRAPDEVRRMFDAVLEAKNVCMDALHDGVLGSEMFNLCCDFLERASYPTIRGGRQIGRGFIHNLGHGVGLEIHESPSMSEVSRLPLREHSIVTVEPGLYDPKIGGVRIEDIVEITKKGCNNLTKMETQLEL